MLVYIAMQATILIRISSQLLSTILGGMGVFCLYYAGQLSDFNAICYCFCKTLEYGGCATAIVYFQGRYLDR
jgi:hypothetical protein